MQKTPLKLLSACAVFLAAFTLSLPEASAKTEPVNKSSTKKTLKKSKKPVNPDVAEPDIKGALSTDFKCELGAKLTLYRLTDDDRHIALRWNKRLHRLTRVDTSTGANRFENQGNGLVWIGIPAKSMLLDSKKGQQLANECKSAEQIQTPPEALEQVKS